MASLHYRPGNILAFGWTMMYKLGHPVATLTNDEGVNTSFSQNNANCFCESLPLLLGKDSPVAQLFPFYGLQAVNTVLLSSYCSHRVLAPAPVSNDIERSANIVTRKGRGSAGRRVSDLLEALLFAMNHPRLDPELPGLTAAAAKTKLLMRWDGRAFNTKLF
eukprot:4815186-Pleurochrysis_carterae.AAC.7